MQIDVEDQDELPDCHAKGCTNTRLYFVGYLRKCCQREHCLTLPALSGFSSTLHWEASFSLAATRWCCLVERLGWLNVGTRGRRAGSGI